MENRLQFLLKKNAGKRDMEKYKEILSKLVIGNDYHIMNLEGSDVISENIMKTRKILQDDKLIWTHKQIPFSEKTN